MIRRSHVAGFFSLGLLGAMLYTTGGPAGADPPRPSSTGTSHQPFPTSAMSASKILTFAGYQWMVKSSTSPIGPGPNRFNGDGPFVDSSGALHLSVEKIKGKWECSEVVLKPTLGYGTYRWTIRGPVPRLDPNVVLALFTYDSKPSPQNKEMDFEASRFANADDPTNAQYVVQPYQTRGNLQRITLPKNSNVTTLTMTWVPGRVTFFADSLSKWTNTSSAVPTSSGAKIYMSLWLFQGYPPSNGKSVSVTINDFHFKPDHPSNRS
jgi:hypothetical protein